jgi:hypothetical protein
VKARYVALILRLSCGFHRQKTISRLSLSDIAKWIRCNVSSVSRADRDLRKARRISKSDPKGDHFYYSLRRPVAKKASADAKPHGATANTRAPDAKQSKQVFASTQSPRGGVSHISSVIPQIVSNCESAYLKTGAVLGKKSLKTDIKKV